MLASVVLGCGAALPKRAVTNDEVASLLDERYGNTTAASIPLALHEAGDAGLVRDGALVCLAAFGAGFTWGAALLRW